MPWHAPLMHPDVLYELRDSSIPFPGQRKSSRSFSLPSEGRDLHNYRLDYHDGIRVNGTSAGVDPGLVSSCSGSAVPSEYLEDPPYERPRSHHGYGDSSQYAHTRCYVSPRSCGAFELAPTEIHPSERSDPPLVHGNCDNPPSSTNQNMTPFLGYCFSQDFTPPSRQAAPQGNEVSGQNMNPVCVDSQANGSPDIRGVYREDIALLADAPIFEIKSGEIILLADVI